MEQVKPTVLVVDDSRVVRKAANTILQGEYHVVEVGNGTEALAVLKGSSDVAAVFLDLWMPGIDGFEVLEILRDSKDPRLVELPVIVITGHSENAEIRDRALSLGASDFVGKPFTGAQLLGSVKQVLSLEDEDDLIVPREAANDAKVEPAKKVDGETQEIKDQVVAKPQPKLGQLSRREYLATCGNSLLEKAISDRRGLAVLKLRIERVGALYHKCGEAFARETLRDLGKIISHETRRKDLLIRLNITDFVVVMPATTGLEARDISKSIIRAVRRHVIHFKDQRFHLTMSGGLVTPRLTSQAKFEGFLSQADERLAKAIENGGGQLVLDEQKVSDTDSRMSLDDATQGLKQGDSSIAKAVLPGLLRKVFPLLVFANTQLKLGIDDELKQLHDRLDGLKR